MLEEDFVGLDKFFKFNFFFKARYQTK